MFRKLSVIVLLVLAAIVLVDVAARAQAPKKSALDKPTMEAYVRHLFVMDSRVKVEVSDPKPADLPGFVQMMVHASMGTQAQDFSFYVSKDGSKIVQGTIFDVNSNPFKNDLDKLKTEGAANFGTAGAPVAIVEFSDFECPYCKEEASMLRANLPATYPKQVHVYFKEFPLQTLHPWAKAGAIAGRCVLRQNNDAFWEFHDWIFPHQSEITADNLKDKVMEWARQKKSLDAAKLGQCIDGKATEAEVDRSIAEGKALNVEQTPTLFVNGRRIGGALDWPSLHSIIDYEIEYQKTAKNAGEDCGCELKLDLPVTQDKKIFPLSPLKKQ
jgi:protein-disulfide isomerase